MRVKDFSNGRLGRICQHALDVPHRHVDRAQNRNDLSGLALGDGVIAIARLWVNESRLQEPCLVIVAEVANWDSGAAGEPADRLEISWVRWAHPESLQLSTS